MQDEKSNVSEQRLKVHLHATYPTMVDTAYLGGIDKHKWMWYDDHRNSGPIVGKVLFFFKYYSIPFSILPGVAGGLALELL